MEVEEGASVGVGGGKIKVGVCVMEKKVKCGSDVIFHFFKKYCYCSMFSSTDEQTRMVGL